MNLTEWLIAKGYDPSKGLCVTVGTDGLNVERDNLLSVSIAGPSCPAETIYIDGADCEATYKYTGVNCTYYDENKVGIDRAVELLSKHVTDAEFIVGYRVRKWLKPWLASQIPELFSRIEWLDLVDVIQLGDLGYDLPMPVDDLETLAYRLQGALVGLEPTSFENYCDRFLFEEVSNDNVVLEDKVKQLSELYNHVRMRG